MARPLAGLVFGTAVLVAAALGLSSRASGEPTATRVIDRTLLCETGVQGGVNVVTLNGSSSKPGKDSAGVDITTRLVPTWRLASIGERAVELSPACRRPTARAPLASTGLVGVVASPFGDEFDCWTPRRVLIRVRAVFESPATLRLGRPWGFPLLFARGKVEEAWLAIRTQAGKPMAFAAVSETGRTRVFTARRDCFPD